MTHVELEESRGSRSWGSAVRTIILVDGVALVLDVSTGVIGSRDIFDGI